MRMARWTLVVAAWGCTPVQAQGTPPGEVDAELARLIASVPAIDNHAHPVLPPPNQATDRGFDALPVDSMEPQTDPAGWRPDSLQLGDAWRALWRFTEAPPLSAGGLKRPAARRGKSCAPHRRGVALWG